MNRLLKIIFFGLLAALNIFAPLAKGAMSPLAFAFVELVILVLLFVWLLRWNMGLKGIKRMSEFETRNYYYGGI